MTVIADVRERDNDDVIVCAIFVCNELRDHRQKSPNNRQFTAASLHSMLNSTTSQIITIVSIMPFMTEQPFLYEAVRFITNRTRCLTMEQ